ncbi:hypothetical protein TRFO_42227 [Tritrichomonas foetus]|uniref:Uncharacterized protein n=1 Tax=Tritrichomonas foetus TaxID=1144522 RepID=A0A1J4L1Y6_9EUKA|nr:hypothetical protein TRFO_42227 [Tritrichomonas foetus]|eukprot:OHT15901.1 hypothetical protein TRFO_42227 [Tritrichomonas foetus]
MEIVNEEILVDVEKIEFNYSNIKTDEFPRTKKQIEQNIKSVCYPVKRICSTQSYFKLGCIEKDCKFCVSYNYSFKENCFKLIPKSSHFFHKNNCIGFRSQQNVMITTEAIIEKIKQFFDSTIPPLHIIESAIKSLNIGDFSSNQIKYIRLKALYKYRGTKSKCLNKIYEILSMENPRWFVKCQFEESMLTSILAESPIVEKLLLAFSSPIITDTTF